MENNFYIYAILDPRKKEKSIYYIDNYEIIFEYKPFYIGKGKKWRLTQHFYNCSLKKNTYKNNKILKIIREGYKPISIKIIEKLTEIDAYNLEIKVISNIGLDNLTNKTIGGIGQCSISMIGDKNPMFGKHPTAWNKGTKGLCPSKFKGKKIEEVCGEEKAKIAKEKQSNSRKGKSWEEYFGEETAKRVREERSIQRTGSKHSEETKRKMREKITPESILNLKTLTLEKRKKKFDTDFNSEKENIVKMINDGYADNEIIKRIINISRFRLKKMIFLIKNKLNSDYYFKIEENGKENI